MQEKVYLINCPPGWLKTPPLGLFYITSYLNKNNIRTKVIDLNILGYKLWSKDKRKWLSLNADFENSLYSQWERKYPHIIDNIIQEVKLAKVIGLSLFKRNLNFSLQLAKRLKDVYPQKTIVLGGPHTLFMKLHKDAFSSQFRWVIGEGELSIESILKGEKKSIWEFQELDNLDDLPFPDYRFININDYSNFLPLFSSRGCIKKCAFCTERQLFKKFRQNSPQYIVDQISYYYKKYNCSNYVFVDSLINANLEWLEDFCKGIIKNNLKIKWEAQAIIRDDFTHELARLLKGSGCFNLFVGLESGSDRILKMMNKGFSKDTAIRFFYNLKKAGLHFEISLILGYPGEKEEDFSETKDFIIKNKHLISKIAQLNPYVDYYSPMYKISALGKKRVKELLHIIDTEKINYTKSFVNNLCYEN